MSFIDKLESDSKISAFSIFLRLIYSVGGTPISSLNKCLKRDKDKLHRSAKSSKLYVSDKFSSI